MVFHSSLVASGLIPPQLRMELVLPWRLRSYAEEEGRLWCMFMFMFMCIFISSAEAAVTDAAAADEAEMMDELLAVVAVAVVIVVAAVVVVLTGMMEVSRPISRSSLKVDH